MCKHDINRRFDKKFNDENFPILRQIQKPLLPILKVLGLVRSSVLLLIVVNFFFLICRTIKFRRVALDVAASQANKPFFVKEKETNYGLIPAKM